MLHVATVVEMENQDHVGQAGPTLRDLYPHLSPEELKEADENLSRYIQLALRIYDRVRNDPEAYARFKALTASELHPTMKFKGSNQ
jgi:hypothetical protein